MNHLHTRTRRLVAAILLVGGVALGLTLSAFSASAHGSGSTGIVSYYHHSTLLGSTTVATGGGLDVVWKDTICSKGYSSPPVAFTWSGTSTGTTSAPLIGPCGHGPGEGLLKGPDDWRCRFFTPDYIIHCYATYRKADSASPTASAKSIGNPDGGTIGNVYLYGRTALYAYLVTPGKPTKKISVPAGADTIKFAPAP
jgi:hypothetical protein